MLLEMSSASVANVFFRSELDDNKSYSVPLNHKKHCNWWNKRAKESVSVKFRCISLPQHFWIEFKFDLTQTRILFEINLTCLKQ